MSTLRDGNEYDTGVLRGEGKSGVEGRGILPSVRLGQMVFIPLLGTSHGTGHGPCTIQESFRPTKILVMELVVLMTRMIIDGTGTPSAQCPYSLNLMVFRSVSTLTRILDTINPRYGTLLVSLSDTPSPLCLFLVEVG